MSEKIREASQNVSLNFDFEKRRPTIFQGRSRSEVDTSDDLI